MRTLQFLIAFLLAALMLAGGCTYKGYHRAIELRDAVAERWLPVDDALQERYDLVSKLLDSMKAAIANDEELVQRVSQSCDAYRKAETIQEKAHAASDAETHLAVLFAHVPTLEAKYPQLKADRSFADLKKEVEKTDGRVMRERNRYNEMVKRLKAFSHNFPGEQFAHIAGVEQPEFFEAPDEVPLPVKKSAQLGHSG